MPKNTKSDQLLLPIINEQKPQLCKCGCGMATKWNKKKKRFNVYIRQHHLVAFWQNPEYREKMSKQSKSLWQNPERRENYSKQISKAHNTPEYRDKLSKRMTIQWSNAEYKDKMSEIQNNLEYKEKISKQSKSLWQNPDHRENISNKMKAVWENAEHKESMSKRMKKLWQDPEYAKKCLSASGKSPNKPETIINMITSEDIQYTGNRSWWRKIRILVNGEYVTKSKNPDFKIKGQKKVIELYGDYWHKNDNPDDLINAYKEIGFDCLVIWESEIYNELENTIEKISQFMDKSQWQMTLL